MSVSKDGPAKFKKGSSPSLGEKLEVSGTRERPSGEGFDLRRVGKE